MPKHLLTCPIPLPSQMWTPPSSPSSTPPPPSAAAAAKTMEEVWEDIALTADLHHHPPSRGVTLLQDFFSNPTTASGFSALPPPNLSSAPARINALPHHRVQPISPADAVVPGGGKKRPPELDRRSDDLRQKRTIKNRESAARSRARKQAYRAELEHAIDKLLEENAELKKKQEQEKLLRDAEAAARLMEMEKKPLQRTLTAPF